jgi:hypothetical protein
MDMIKDRPNTNLMQNDELAIELYEAYKALCKTKEFETLIDKGYLDTFLKNQVGLLATVPESEKARTLDSIKGCGMLEKWLLTVQMLGENAISRRDSGEYEDMTGDVVSLEDEVGA